MLVAAQEHVIDRQLAAYRVLPQGVGPQADAAALERHERVFHRGQRAGELGHLLAFDLAAVARLEHRLAQPELEQLGLHLLFGLHVVGVFFALHAEQRRLGDVDECPWRPAGTSGDRRT